MNSDSWIQSPKCYHGARRRWMNKKPREKPCKCIILIILLFIFKWVTDFNKFLNACHYTDQFFFRFLISFYFRGFYFYLNICCKCWILNRVEKLLRYLILNFIQIFLLFNGHLYKSWKGSKVSIREVIFDNFSADMIRKQPILNIFNVLESLLKESLLRISISLNQESLVRP